MNNELNKNKRESETPETKNAKKFVYKLYDIVNVSIFN